MTRPWYHTAFQGDYVERYAHRDDREARRAIESLLVPLSFPRGSRVLDLACGAGRHAIELQRHGFDVTGGDLSMPLLRHAREDFAGDGLPFSGVRLDMRRLPFRDASFQLVTNFFTAFGYFEDDEENFAVFAEVARVLAPGGRFLFDFLNGDRVAAELAPPSAPVRDDRGPLGIWATTKGLTADGRRAVKVEERVDGPGQRLEESVRLFRCGELVAALAARGLEPEATFGDYGGGVYRSTSPRFIALCKRSPTPGKLPESHPA